MKSSISFGKCLLRLRNQPKISFFPNNKGARILASKFKIVVILLIFLT
ncbi:hypothetical protein CP8484711_0439, partial [Chlamydia psittaci 84-8471/1]